MTIENHIHDYFKITSWSFPNIGDEGLNKLGLDKSRYPNLGWQKLAKCSKGRCDGVLIFNADQALMRRMVEKKPDLVVVKETPGLLEEGKWGILADFEPLKGTKEVIFQ